MEELFQSNDPVLLSFATAMLTGEDIEVEIFDVHMSIVGGSLGMVPRRVMVWKEDAERAKRILRDNGVDFENGGS